MNEAPFIPESFLSDATVDNIAAPDEHHKIILLVPQLPQPQQVKKKRPKIHPSKIIPVVHSGKIIHAHHHHGKAEHGHSHDVKAKHHHEHAGNSHHKHNHYGIGTVKHSHAGKSQHHHKHAGEAAHKHDHDLKGKIQYFKNSKHGPHGNHQQFRDRAYFPQYINNADTQNAMNAFFLQRYLEASARQDSDDPSANLIRVHIPSFEGRSAQEAEVDAESDFDILTGPVKHVAESLQTPYDSRDLDHNEPNAFISDENEEAAMPFPVFSYPLASSENNVIAHSGVYHYRY